VGRGRLSVSLFDRHGQEHQRPAAVARLPVAANHPPVRNNDTAR
jgi:hypothetical protein